MKGSLLAGVILSVLAVQPALAQEEVSVKNRGANAISLGVNDDSVGIGLWHKMTEQSDVGLDFALYYDNGDYSDYQSYELSPAVKYYLLPNKSASPYLYGALVGRYAEGEAQWSRTKTYTAGAMGGIGLEWFPVENLSVGGHVGVRGQYQWQRQRQQQSRYDEVSSYSTKNDGFVGGTFNSGIRMNLFF